MIYRRRIVRGSGSSDRSPDSAGMQRHSVGGVSRKAAGDDFRYLDQRIGPAKTAYQRSWPATLADRIAAIALGCDRQIRAGFDGGRGGNAKQQLNVALPIRRQSQFDRLTLERNNSRCHTVTLACRDEEPARSLVNEQNPVRCNISRGAASW